AGKNSGSGLWGRQGSRLSLARSPGPMRIGPVLSGSALMIRSSCRLLLTRFSPHLAALLLTTGACAKAVTDDSMDRDNRGGDSAGGQPPEGGSGPASGGTMGGSGGAQGGAGGSSTSGGTSGGS